MVTISESDDSHVVWPDLGIQVLKYGAPLRDHIPDWILRVKRIWNLCLEPVPFGISCAICGKQNSDDMPLSTCCLCDITTHTSCLESVMHCDEMRLAITSTQREYRGFRRNMPNIMVDETGHGTRFCLLCNAAIVSGIDV